MKFTKRYNIIRGRLLFYFILFSFCIFFSFDLAQSLVALLPSPAFLP